MSQVNNREYFKKNMVELVIYFLMFFIMLTPFHEHGILKIMSVSLILAFFAGILNTILREYFEWKEKLIEKEAQEKINQEYMLKNINRVTGEKESPKEYILPDGRATGQRDPQDRDFIDGQHY